MYWHVRILSHIVILMGVEKWNKTGNSDQFIGTAQTICTQYYVCNYVLNTYVFICTPCMQYTCIHAYTSYVHIHIFQYIYEHSSIILAQNKPKRNSFYIQSITLNEKFILYNLCNQHCRFLWNCRSFTSFYKIWKLIVKI